MEVNVKIIESGTKLTLITKKISLKGKNLSPSQVYSISTRLSKSGIPAVPFNNNKILIPFTKSLRQGKIDIDNWPIELIEEEQPIKLDFKNKTDRQLIADLYKWELLYQINKKPEYWILRNSSNRIFYENNPLEVNIDKDLKIAANDIDVFRRFQVSDLIIDYAGIGFSVDVGTLFVTHFSLADYLESNHEDYIYELLSRQKEQKGTLIFCEFNGTRRTCYFEEIPEGMTCDSTPSFKLGNNYYENVYDYYKKKYPECNLYKDDKVVAVSFRGMGQPVYIPAKRSLIRVMNEHLPSHLRNIDKIPPHIRCKLINKFWKSINMPFAGNFNQVSKNYFIPPKHQQGIIKLPDLIFGKSGILRKPERINPSSYKENFRLRKKLLIREGCYYVSPNMKRDLYFPYPEEISEQVIGDFSNLISSKINKITGKQVQCYPIPYSNYEDIIRELNEVQNPQMAVFIFNNQINEPAIYYEISRQLKRWKLKRVTSAELINHHRIKERKGGIWNSFVRMNTLDIIQQLGCIPYVPNPSELPYDAQLVIDVSEKRSHFSFSLFIYKEGMPYPILDTFIERKTERKEETINREILKKFLKLMLVQHEHVLNKYQIKSMLVLRDGKDCGDEQVALNETIEELKGSTFSAEFEYDFAEYRKTSQKEVRFWFKNGERINNVIEGSYFKTDNHTAFLATTGAGTLNQGTASLLHIRLKNSKSEISRTLDYIFKTSQLNFSSPEIAQKLTLPAKRADELLKEKRAQEVLRLT